MTIQERGTTAFVTATELTRNETYTFKSLRQAGNLTPEQYALIALQIKAYGRRIEPTEFTVTKQDYIVIDDTKYFTDEAAAHIAGTFGLVYSNDEIRAMTDKEFFYCNYTKKLVGVGSVE